MAQNLDALLGTLRASSLDVRLDGLEADVWTRVEADRRARALGDGGLRTQVAVALAALLVGAVVGGASVERRPARNEMVVLSEDAGLTPSVAIEGGA